MHRGKFSLTPKNQVKDLAASSFPNNQHRSLPEPIYVSSSSDDESIQSNDDASKQFVLYDDVTNGGNPIELTPDPLRCKPPVRPRNKPSPSSSSSRVLPAVGAFTVQCASCFKWRLIPTKEKYEEIREYILQHPFVCQKAREWRPDVSCDDPEDISQDGSRIWAIDKPNIAQPPDGWQRLLRIRGEGSSKFADIYYVAPSGKRLRSMVEVQKFLMDHPEYMTDGVTLSRFSFQIPKPLQENYVRKRPSRSVEPEQVCPLAWGDPEDGTNSNERRLGLPDPCNDSDPVSRPAKKQATQSSLHKDAV
ncbi:methyl-CpG-binding domain-containing protein 2-like [Cicer arietinum]|uniref:Methyl-CpG-binding domain-containing protein 2-like n=1 Tax=Cicer arietinum TaxID=3827 RepID=A0A1S2Z144_CICAR|nr:methyl-CpG-binding domain-containing protein 2-like [Cicer arietinum]